MVDNTISGLSRVGWAFEQLDENGDIELTVNFYLEGFRNEKGEDDTRYVVALPEYVVDVDRNVELTDAMRNLGVEGQFWGMPYFRVTEEQWDILTSAFFAARDASTESINEVRFTFEELFG